MEMTFSLTELLVAISVTIAVCTSIYVPTFRALRRLADARAEANYELGQIHAFNQMGNKQLEDLLKAATKPEKEPRND